MRVDRLVGMCWGLGLLVCAALAAPAGAQERATPAQALLGGAGGAEQYPHLYRRALNVQIEAEEKYVRGDAAGAAALIDKLFADAPPGSDRWYAATPVEQATMDAGGINIGSPACYYALRMLRDCCDMKLSGQQADDPATVVWTIVLVGHLEGRQPKNDRQRAAGTGPKVRLDLDPRISADDYRVVRVATQLFREYVAAMTVGRLQVRLNFLPLPELTVPGIVEPAPGVQAGLGDGGMGAIWNAVSPEQKRATDWWWVLYPSIVPGQHPAFRTTEFVTGGMGVGEDGRSPCFIIDDQWLLRKPPHLGHGPMHDLERRAYLPQWLQHEFFHHLFREYPEFRLESARGHDWFDRSTWPSAFEGNFEPDYYYEALHKRLQLASTPLHVRLRYASQDLSGTVTPQMLAGRYRRAPVENDWHVGTLSVEAEGPPRRYRWTNRTGVSWLLTDDLARGALVCDDGSPYADEDIGKEFQIDLGPVREGEARAVAGFRFHTETYRRVGGGRRARGGE